MAAAPAGAERPVELHDDVPELGSGAGRAAVQTAVQDQAAADARTQREHHDVGGATPRARLPFGDCGGVAVVVDPHRQPMTLAHAVAKVEVRERDVDRRDRPPRALVDARREAEADRRRVRVRRPERIDGAVELSQQRVL